MNYSDSIRLLTCSSKFQIKLGLERMSALLEIIGNPQEKVKIIHTAGTNGKGSVCSVLANILKCSGYKTGLYTSPHLLEYTERIKINGLEIPKQTFAELTEEICLIAEKNNIDLTEFEILTAMAYKYFADNKVDFAIMETGLGGRFDATNVCKKPLLEIITSVSIDHTDRLGDTVEKIAYEKAGIIKKASVVIVSSKNDGFSVIKDYAEKIGARVIGVDNEVKIVWKNGVNYAVLDENKYEFPMLGSYQKQNLALVFSAVEFLRTKGYKISLEEGLRTVKWAARLQFIKEKNLLIDGAHNPSAANELKKSLDYYFPKQKRIFIYGTINTKDYKKIAQILFNPEDEIYYYEFNHPNNVNYEEYIKNVPFLKKVYPYKKEALQKEELKILTGSFYMIGEFLKATLH